MPATESVKRIYADNAATTKMSQGALRVMTECLQDIHGNPSSLHTAGQQAAVKLTWARETIAECLHANPREIYFTSGGSEADNQAILSAAQLGKKKGKNHIISTKIEHHAVLHTLQRLEKEGYEITLLDVGEDGIVEVEDVKNAIREETALVTIMAANNEIGTIQPIREIGTVCRERGVLFHTDAVQAVGHIPLDLSELPVDMLSLSAHKFHGPKGVGVLYATKGSLLTSLIEGGAQERGKRAGTENVAGIVAMAQALSECVADLEKNADYVKKLRDKLIEGLEKIPHSKLNGHKTNRLPGNVNFCFEGIEGESLLLLLDRKGIEASSGSACTSGSLDPSHVLLALGLPHEVAHGSLRLTLNEENTEEDVDTIIRETEAVVTYLRNMSPVWDELEKGELKHVI